MKIQSKFYQAALFLFAVFALSIINANAQWQRQAVETKASLRGLSVAGKNVVWASGTGGTYLRTIDGGKTWTVGTVPGAEKLDFRDVEAFGAQTAYLLSIGEGENSRIYKTADGGATWQMQFKNANPKAFFDAIAFWDENNGIAMSDPVDGKYHLISTADGGRSWNVLPNDKMPSAKQGEAAFAASGTCLITNGKTDVYLVSGGSDARVFRSTDRGLSWSVADTPIVKGTSGSGIFSIAMFDGKNGVIVGGNYEKPDAGNNNSAFTLDGGKTWNLANGLSGYFSGVAFINRKMLIAVGSTRFALSFDGGKNWKYFPHGNKNLNAVRAKGKNAVWAVGADGFVGKYAHEVTLD